MTKVWKDRTGPWGEAQKILHVEASAVLDLLNTKINAALNAKPVQERFETLSLEASHMDRAAAARYIESEVTKWGKLVKELDIKVD